jgi:hypothetical protein
MEYDETPRPEERGALGPPDRTRPTAVGTATPPPPRPPRRWQQRGGRFESRGPLRLRVLCLALAALLAASAALFPALTLGAVTGGAIGSIGFLRARGRTQWQWLLVTAFGGALGGALGEWYLRPFSSEGIARSPTGSLALDAVIGMQIALLSVVLAACIGSLLSEHRSFAFARRFSSRRGLSRGRG